MGGLLDGLTIAHSGLNAARAGVQLAGHNITNVNTEGFHRRTLSLSPIDPPPTLGGGVRTEGAVRVDDQLLDRQVLSSLGGEAFSAARQSLMLRLEQAAARLDEGGLGGAISKLFSSFSALATAPQDLTARSQVVLAAEGVAQAFNRSATALDAIAEGADLDLTALASEANEAAAGVAALNARIAQADAAGVDSGDLRDQRDLKVDRLAELIGVSAFERDDGMVTVLVGGMTVVDRDQSGQLTVTPDAALGGRLRFDLVRGGATTDVTGSVSGRAGGLISVRDQDVAGAKTLLDGLATDLATAINTQHAAGYGLDGVGGRDLFAAPAATDAAANMTTRSGLVASEIAASSDATSLPGNNENALALSALATDRTVAGGGTKTASAQLSDIVGQIAADAADAQATAAVHRDQLSHLESLRQSAQGVSVDEEMVNLVQFQRAYQASAKVLQVIDQLLARLMEV